MVMLRPGRGDLVPPLLPLPPLLEGEDAAACGVKVAPVAAGCSKSGVGLRVKLLFNAGLPAADAIGAAVPPALMGRGGSLLDPAPAAATEVAVDREAAEGTAAEMCASGEE